ncbi:NADH-quinone oxidoreductase subunit J [Candidatus Sumerlaeota bacterium]|nr:NADH-quinone oxidoreductase subunit J [Candidatus Sumerlaeota bacterium]
MTVIFYLSAIIAVAATFLAITRTNAVHALLYLAVSLLAVAMVLFTLGAPFAAALEIVIYAGAIVVLFVFVVMMLNQGTATIRRERAYLTPSMWIVPGLLTLVLFAELVCVVAWVPEAAGAPAEAIGPKAVGMALFGPYAIAVEMASLLLLAGLIGAFHLGRRDEE